MLQGWIKLHRNFLEWNWFESDNHLRLFLVLLLKANHKTTNWRKIKLGPGQLITGRKQLSLWSGLSQQSIRTVLNDFLESNFITIKTTNKFSIITIVDWNKYQNSENANQQTNQQTTNKQPTTNQQLTTSKNVKNVKNVKKKNIVNHNAITTLYNNIISTQVPKALVCKKLSQSRIDSIDYLTKNHLEDAKAWKQYFEQAAQQAFIKNNSGQRSGNITIDTFLKEEIYIKVIEGMYQSDIEAFTQNWNDNESL